jgi:hypothetical protein
MLGRTAPEAQRHGRPIALEPPASWRRDRHQERAGVVKVLKTLAAVQGYS